MHENHGQSGTRLYRIWAGMKQRCYNEGQRAYKNYGARGIKMCDEWKDSFLSFKEWAETNGYADDLTIERVDNDGNYEPSNCKWITRAAQNNNRRTSNWVEAFGERKTIQEWTADPRCKIGKRGLSKRLNKGWTPEEAITTAAHRGKRTVYTGDGSCITEGCPGTRESRGVGKTRRLVCWRCRLVARNGR